MVKLNLSKKIILAIVILLIIVSLGLGTISTILSSRAVENEVNTALLELSKEGARHIDSRIMGNLNTLQELANDELIKTMDLEVQRKILRADRERLGYEDFGLVRPNGDTYMIKDGTNMNLKDLDYVQEALSGSAVVSDVFIGHLDNRLKVAYTVPIINGENVVGAIIGYRNALNLSSIIEDMGFGENGYAYLISSQGTFFAHENEEYIRDQINIFKDIEEDGEFKNVGLAIEKIGVGNSGVAKYNLLGSERIIGISPMESKDWILGVGTYEKDTRIGINNLQKNVFMVVSIAIIFASLVAWFLGQYISKPIVLFSNTIERIANYDLIIREDKESLKILERNDEVGNIARALKRCKQT